MRRNTIRILALAAGLLSGCGQKASKPDPSMTLPQARQGFVTKLASAPAARSPVPEPPAPLFTRVQYSSPVGNLWAYLSPSPNDGKKHPAIIWITGGDCNSIDEGCWNEGPPNNDQSASAYRKAGIVMMFPSLRGGNDNPGKKEGFLGEVEDVLAAADYLSKQDYVDPGRIYLGGHSTGGTLVLLVGECSDRFRAVFSFGPVDNVAGYGPEYLPFDTSNSKEIDLRSPGLWLHSIRGPVFVFEGGRDGNGPALENMARTSTNAKAKFFLARGADHFSVLAPLNRLISQKILGDQGVETNIAFTQNEVDQAAGR